MYSINYFLISVILLVMFNNCFVHSMTREQIKNSGKLIKKTCSAKNDLTEDEVKDVDKGKFLEKKDFMCYIACVYKMGQSVKGSTINHDMMLRQVDIMFPNDMKAPVKAAIEHCRPVAKNYKDLCEASYWTAKCIYDFDPANFMFP
ncbi:general odorant-binding protein 72-like isoform X2 [Spodoptera frugiperda]|uniref:General odorant-binding protein 72-like isoform X2 n=1 Tax=Spodoptera frugiperda TaxID=7108 RepID=A0A9R0DMX3_SPOFR|nr:general odorant-binding protein 72-like isoform X2 [Spodoptera frugiperda]